PFTVPTNVVLTLAGSGGKSLQNWATNAGTINWTGGSWSIVYNYGLYNLAGAAINIQCDQTIGDYWGGEFINNAGLFRKWVATGTSSIYVQYIGTGVVDAESGTMNFNNAFSQTGGAWAIGIDGLGSNGHIGLSGAATLAGTLDVNLDNNYVLGLSNSFNIISYSSYSGTFSTTNIPTDGASWQLTYGANAVTLLITNLLSPAIAITSPTNNQNFTIPVNIPITTSVTDTNAAIATVQFYQGTNLIGQTLSSPYNFTWNSVAPGVYTISAWAIDALGAVATSAPVNVTVYSNQAQTTNYTWTGAVSSDWFTPGNWSPNGVPGVLDNVTIANGGTVNVGGSATVNNINFNSGTLQGPGLLSATNAFNWTGGTVAGLLTIPANAALNIGGNVNLSGATLVNLGTVFWTGGSLSGNAATVITNSGLWLAEAANQIYLNGGSFINNSIFRTLNNGGATFFNSLSFVNNGTVDAQAGPVFFQSGGTLAGTYNTAPGAYIYFNSGAFTLGALPVFTGAGASEFTGGTLTMLNDIAPALPLVNGTVVLGPAFQGGSITNLTISGSTLSGTNTVTGTFNWTGGALSGQLTVALNGVLNISGSDKNVSSSTLINSGQVNWTGGNLNGNSASMVTNNSLWLVQCDNQIGFGNGAATFVNNGILRKSAAGGTTTITGLAFNNNGTLDAQSGAFNLNSGGTLSGTYNTASGAYINFNGGGFALAAFPAITGGGTTRLTGGTLTLASDIVPGLLLEGGTVALGAAFQNAGAINNLTNLGATLSGNYTVTGAYTWGAGALSGSLTVASNAVLNLVSGGNLNFGGSFLTNFGTVFWNGAPLHGSSGTLWVNNGLWLEESDDQVYIDGGSVTFINNSTFRKQGTFGTTYFNNYVPFQNNGFVDVATGAVNFAGGGPLGGTYNVAQFAAVILSAGSFSAGTPPLFEGPGASQFTGGTLTLLADQIPNLLLAGGNLVLGPAFQNSGAISNLTLSGSSLTGSNTLTGTLNWNAGGLNN
ncbi:MAG: Ig-like domain-containing protein, partial [Verrucomicrobiota bacterium]